jgi:hypothetical protein
MGEEKRKEAAARKINASAAQQFAHRNCRVAENCRRYDHRGFEISLGEKIIWSGNTFESFIA